jgi:hypothetical protein
MLYLLVDKETLTWHKWVRQPLKGNKMEEKFLSTREAADYLKVSTGTLENWRYAGDGPKFSKPKGTVYYALSDLQEWIKG